MKENGGVNKPLAPHLQHSVGAIGRAASAEGTPIVNLDGNIAQRLIAGLKGSSKRSARLGIARINDLIDRRDEFPEIADLLPRQKIKIPEKESHPADIYARSSGHPLASLLWEDFDGFVLSKRGVNALGRQRSPVMSKFGEVTERTYANVILQVIRLFINFGILLGNERLRLRDICNIDQIEDFEQCWKMRQMNGEVKVGSHNYYAMACRLHTMAVYLGANEKEVTKIKEVLKNIREESPDMSRMSEDREKFLREFMRDEESQARLFRSPEILKQGAQKILNKWATVNQKERMLALKMGLAACTNAILYRASPMRAGNLNSLKIRGDQQSLTFKGDLLLVDIPGEAVKNRKAIHHTSDDDAAQIVEWYINVIRPKLLHEHPYGFKLHDSEFLFPSTKLGRPLEATTFADHYSDGIGTIGLDLTFHLARHICATIILWENPNAWAEAAAVLGDEISTVKKFYVFLDEQRASREGRGIFSNVRKRICGSRQGKYDV